MVDSSESINVLTTKRYVSRGGEKLEHALDHFSLDVRDRSVLDAGVSTGGFTDCLLQRGARRVLALDVGRNQLHEKIKRDHRVTWSDGVNVRDLEPGDMAFACSLIVADLSFISLTKVLDAFVRCVSVEAEFDVPQMVLLVKPQFEVGRREVSKGKGVIIDPNLHAEAIDGVADYVLRLGCHVVGTVESPIKGAEGNTEFLMLVNCPTVCVG